MDVIGPLPITNANGEGVADTREIPPFRLHKYGSEDIRASRKLEPESEDANESADNSSSFRRASSVLTPEPEEKRLCWRAIETGEPGSHSYCVLLQGKDNVAVSPWSDVPLWTPDSYVRLIVKTPRGMWSELDVAMDDQRAPLQIKMRLGKLSHYSVNCPWNICMLPQTWADPELNCGGFPYNGRPIEVIELSMKSRKVGEAFVAKFLGGFSVIDTELGNISWKLIAIDVEDMSAAILHDVLDLHEAYPGLLEEVREWLRIRNCTVKGDPEALFGHNGRVLDRQTMMIEVTQAHIKWQSLTVSKKHLRGVKQHRRTPSSVQPIPTSDPEPNQLPPGVSLSPQEADPNGEEFEVSKFSLHVPKFLRIRSRKSNPAFLQNFAESPKTPISPAVKKPAHLNFAGDRKPRPNHKSHSQDLSILTSDGGRIIIDPKVHIPDVNIVCNRAYRPFSSFRGVPTQDIMKRRTGVDLRASPRVRVQKSAPAVKSIEPSLVYAASPKPSVFEDDENIPLAPAVGTEEPTAAETVPGAGKPPLSISVPQDPVNAPSRSSSGSTARTLSTSPTGLSPCSGAEGAKDKRIGPKDRRVSWGWVEEVEIPSRDGEGTRKERSKPKREGRVHSAAGSSPVAIKSSSS